MSRLPQSGTPAPPFELAGRCRPASGVRRPLRPHRHPGLLHQARLRDVRADGAGRGTRRPRVVPVRPGRGGRLAEQRRRHRGLRLPERIVVHHRPGRRAGRIRRVRLRRRPGSRADRIGRRGAGNHGGLVKVGFPRTGGAGRGTLRLSAAGDRAGRRGASGNAPGLRVARSRPRHRAAARRPPGRRTVGLAPHPGADGARRGRIRLSLRPRAERRTAGRAAHRGARAADARGHVAGRDRRCRARAAQPRTRHRGKGRHQRRHGRLQAGIPAGRARRGRGGLHRRLQPARRAGHYLFRRAAHHRQRADPPTKSGSTAVRMSSARARAPTPR